MSSKSTISKKKLFIDDFKVKNCTQWGEYQIIEDLKRGDSVYLEYSPGDDVIMVKGADRKKAEKLVKEEEKGTCSNEDLLQKIETKLKECNEEVLTVFGEIDLPEQQRKVVVPLLLGKHRASAFECRASSVLPQEPINESVRVSLWAASE